jgi:hypothetical protein
VQAFKGLLPAEYLLHWIIMLGTHVLPPESHLPEGSFSSYVGAGFWAPWNLQTRGRFRQLKKYYAEPR